MPIKEAGQIMQMRSDWRAITLTHITIPLLTSPSARTVDFGSLPEFMVTQAPACKVNILVAEYVYFL